MDLCAFVIDQLERDVIRTNSRIDLAGHERKRVDSPSQALAAFKMRMWVDSVV